MTAEYYLNSYFKDILDHLLEGCQIIGLNWCYLYVNEAAARHARKTSDELLGQKMMDVHPGIDETPMFHTLAQCMAARTSATLVNEFVYPDGATAWFELRVQPIPEGLLVMSLDITERKRAADAIESLARFPSENPNPVLRIDCDGRLLYVNDASHALLTDWQLVVGQPTPSALQTAVTEALTEQLSQTIEVEHGQRIMALFVAPVTAAGYANVYGRDITARKHAEAAIRKINAELEDRVAARTEELRRSEARLRQSEAELREAQRVGQLGSWDWDAITDTITWSEEYYRLYGFDPAQRPPGYEEHLKAYTPESAARLDAAVKTAMETGAPYQLDLEQIRPDGTRRWITARGEVKRRANGQIVGLRGTAQDITERKRSEATLRESARALKLLSECNQVLVRAEDEQSLLDEVCRLIVETGSYRMAWVGFAGQDPAKSVWPVAQMGFEDGYLDRAQITWADTERGRGPTGTAIRTGVVQVNQNFLTNPAMAPWRESAVARGYQSSIALPLKDAQASLGALTIYASTPDAFDAGEASLLTELANDLAYGINVLRVRAERKRMEAALRATKETLQALFDHSPLAIIMLDLDGHIQLWNGAAERMYGWTADEVQGEFLPKVSGETLEEYKAIRDRIAHGESITYMEARRKRKDGSNIWLGLSAAPLRDTAGNIFAQMSIAVDITDLKRADQELRARNRELSILYTISSQTAQSLNFEQALDVALTTTLTALDAEAGGIYLWKPGVPTLRLQAQRGLSALRPGVDEIRPGHSLLGRAIDAQELIVIDRDDYPIDQLPVQVAGSGLSSMVTVPLISGGVMLGALIVGTRRSHAFPPADLNMLAAIGRQLGSAIQNTVLYEQTQQELIRRQRAETALQKINAELETRVAARTRELAAANERLQELDRLKSKFVADVSHELRTPITALSLNVDLLERSTPENRAQCLQAIRQQVQREVQLLEDILNLSRLELGADKVRFAPVALNTLIAQIVTMHQPAAEAKNLTLTFTPCADLPVVSGEENQLAQVITNLIGNALNYTRTGEIQVRTEVSDHAVVIEVRDTGLGIAPEDVPHLFERFYRGCRTRDVRGTGLGLAIVKEIVDLHDGRVEVDSEVGVGSTFRVWLPGAK